MKTNEVFGECSIHPGNSMINCPICHMENMEKKLPTGDEFIKIIMNIFLLDGSKHTFYEWLEIVKKNRIFANENLPKLDAEYKDDQWSCPDELDNETKTKNLFMRFISKPIKFWIGICKIVNNKNRSTL